MGYSCRGRGLHGCGGAPCKLSHEDGHTDAPPLPPALQLLCNLKVSWGRDGNVVRSGREEQCAFAADLNKLTDGLEQVGAGQQFVPWYPVVSWEGATACCIMRLDGLARSV